MRRGRREKLSVTVDPHLYAVVERHAERTKLPRSKIIEEPRRSGRDRGGMIGGSRRDASWRCFGSTVKLETIVTLPKRAVLRRLGHLPAEVIGEVDEALAFSLDLRLAPARKLS
jgi:hypothetical protein